jgi:adenine-specific DNA-methyltransferase
MILPHEQAPAGEWGFRDLAWRANPKIGNLVNKGAARRVGAMTADVERQPEADHDLLGFSWQLQKRHEALTSLQGRKAKGQIFTPPAISAFMASLFSAFRRRLRVLDAGAGVGILSAALCQRLIGLRPPRTLELHLFETDPALLPLIEANMNHCRRELEREGHVMSYTIHAKDFLLATARSACQAGLFEEDLDLGEFDLAIMNPPYFKVGGDSPYARKMADVVHGQPNVYALFLAKAAEMLRANGELVAITPRSFCNGLYFRGFRRWFFERMSLRRIHLFESRTHAFQEAKILQESLITLSRRLGRQARTTSVSTSFGRDLAANLDVQTLPAERVLDDTCGDMVVRIPASADDALVLDITRSWPDRFAGLGLRISTGPVVLFRATRFLLEEPNGQEFAPLLSVHNVRPFRIVWPLRKNNKPAAVLVCPDSLRLLVPARNYVLLRRFSAKEERRRLIASLFLRSSTERPYVALENHLNYVYHAKRELTMDETYGLTALFNSALFDRYFRAISGNTQVNATEIRTMKFPDLGAVAAIGKRISEVQDFDQGPIERIVLDQLHIHGPLRRFLTKPKQ